MCAVVYYILHAGSTYFVYSAIVNIDGDLVMHEIAACPFLGQGILPMLSVNQMNFTRLKNCITLTIPSCSYSWCTDETGHTEVTMLIKEYRIPLPLTVEEYRIAQLYMIQVCHLSSTSRPITPFAEKCFLPSLVFPASQAPSFHHLQ